MTDNKRVSSQFEDEQKDAVDILMGGSKPDKQNTERTQQEHRDNTKSTQRVHEDNTLDIHHIRIHRADWNALQRCFEGKGIKASQGIRMIIKEYLEKEGI